MGTQIWAVSGRFRGIRGRVNLAAWSCTPPGFFQFLTPSGLTGTQPAKKQVKK